MTRLELGTVILVSLAAVSCGDARMAGSIFGSLEIPDCVDGEPRTYTCPSSVAIEDCRAFALEVTFVAMQVYPDNSARLRLQAGGSDFALTDGLLLQIRDTRLLRGALGETMPIGQDENIRGALGLFETCAGSTQNFELTGQVVFDRFGVSKGDRVTGTIRGIEIRDGRGLGAGTVLGFLQGNFDFDVKLGPPYQRFQE